MALLWIEGFEDYGTVTGSNLSSTIIGERYNASSAMRLIAGRMTGYGCTCYAAGDHLMTPAITTNNTLIFGGANKWIGNPADTDLIRFYDGATLGVNLSYTTTGSLLVVKRGSTTLGSIAWTMYANTWLYLEMKVICDGSAGSVIVKANETTILTLTGQNTKASTHDYHDIVDFVYQPTQGGSWDDIYICDGSGSVNNDFLGMQKVMGVYPTSDSGAQEWTTSTGSDHYAMVDEPVEDADSTYVVNSSSPQVDIFGYDNISSGTAAGTIAGIQINTAVRQTDATPTSLITRVVSGATTSDDAGQNVGTTSYTNKRRILETDPNTSAAWTPANFSAATIGVKV